MSNVPAGRETSGRDENRPLAPSSERETSGDRNREVQIRRIVIALDATEQSVRLVEAAVRLAQRLGVEVVGLFVEDINLLRLSELPFAQETGSYIPTRRPLQVIQLERQLRSQAVALQRLVRNVAEQYQVPWSFQVLRGPIATELRKAAAATDLFVIGRSRQTKRRRTILGSTARSFIIEAPRLTMIFHHEVAWQSPLVVVYDGSEAAQRVLALAAQLTAAEDMPLLVVLVGEEEATAQALRQAVATWLHERNLRARYQWLARPNIARLFNIVMTTHGGAVILPSNGLSPHDATLLGLLEELQCPVFLVQ